MRENGEINGLGWGEARNQITLGARDEILKLAAEGKPMGRMFFILREKKKITCSISAFRKHASPIIREYKESQKGSLQNTHLPVETRAAEMEKKDLPHPSSPSQPSFPQKGQQGRSTKIIKLDDDRGLNLDPTINKKNTKAFFSVDRSQKIEAVEDDNVKD